MDSYQPTQEQFLSDVAKHRMRIVRDDGLYRHLEFRGEHGWHHWFEIVTWPGVLVIRGDMETWCFSRVEDMFKFFRGERINPGYWQEKLQCARDSAKRFDIGSLREQAIAHLENYELKPAMHKRVIAELEEEVLGQFSDSEEYPALSALFEFNQRSGRGEDRREHTVTFDPMDGPWGKQWTYHYIWCCRAIVWAIEQYDKGQA